MSRLYSPAPTAASVSFAFDKLGRKTTMDTNVDVRGDGVVKPVNDSWVYDPAGAKGALGYSERMINGVLERSETQIFDALVRPATSWSNRKLIRSTRVLTAASS